MRKKKKPLDQPDFPDANIIATVETNWDPEKQKLELSVTLYPVQPEGEELSTVRVLTGPDDIPTGREKE